MFTRYDHGLRHIVFAGATFAAYIARRFVGGVSETRSSGRRKRVYCSRPRRTGRRQSIFRSRRGGQTAHRTIDTRLPPIVRLSMFVLDSLDHQSRSSRRR